VSVKLRLKRMGSKKRPFYRIVAAHNRFQRDGRFLEICGYYDPMVNPYKLHIERDKIVAWLNKGAQMSETVESLLRTEGIVQEHNRAKTAPAQDKVADAAPEAKPADDVDTAAKAD
jgi:small subunit ribosomal protein S16